MTGQPRDEAGRWASYVRPPVPAVTPRGLPPVVSLPVVRPLFPDVPASVVAVCCPGCVYA